MRAKRIIPVVAVLLAITAVLAVRARRDRGFLYAGTVEATEVDLSPQLVSTISEVSVREGDAVRKGQVIVKLSGADHRIAAEQARTDFDRAQRLFRSGSITEETRDRARFRWEEVALRVSWLDIASPIDGTVLDRFHEPGELVGPQNRLLKLANLDDVWARIYVAQPLLARLSIGGKVEVIVPELDRRRITGSIVHIRDEAEFTPKNVQTRDQRSRLVYAVKVALPNADRLFKPGMTVEIQIPE